MSLALASMVRQYRREGFLHLKQAVPCEHLSGINTLYNSAAKERGQSMYPGALQKMEGTLCTIQVAPPGAMNSTDDGLSRGSTSSVPSRGNRTYYVKCRSEKHRDRLIKRFQKKFGPRMMTEEQAKSTMQDKNWMNNPKFYEEMRKRYYYDEFHAYIRSMGTHHYNLFQSCDTIRRHVLLANPSVLPFVTAAQLTGCVGLRLWCEDLFVKEPFSNALPLHCVLPYLGLSNTRGEVESRGCTMWLFLQDVTMTNGAPCLIRGSQEVMRNEFPTMEDIHRQRTQPVSFDFGLWYRHYKLGEQKIIPHDNDISQTNIQPIFPKSGDILLVDHSTLMGIGANVTSHRWSAVSYSLIPEGSTFTGLRSTWIPKNLLNKTAPGTVLRDDNNFPLLHTEL